MKITILCPQPEFSKQQVCLLKKFGTVVFTGSRREYSAQEIKKLAEGTDILAPDPDNLGGFEKAQPRLTELMESLPNLKGVCLSTTSFGWIDRDYCKKRKIIISSIPGYSGESVAEHTLALLICLAKRIIISDRRYHKNQYKLDLGFELKGKTLGIIGLGNIGGKVAELGKAIGMKIIAYNRSPVKKAGVEMKSFKEVLKQADAISLHTTHEEANRNLIGEKELNQMKNGVIIVNTVDRDLVDEKAMAKALKSGKVDSYAYEGEDLINTPLANVENAIGIKAFAWYTKDSLARNKEIWTNNIISHIKNKPINKIN